ncbi:hypothetical protein RF11_14304 [Thelohanellus kitauei]|uniref:Uncharacterized protein n=1 Tax=Thelohanellus kitauei TaxID=669202 RepID=A0A0C2MTR6_THEKT|nr:hypothetical protein RF11_14304 [Thelohanellus kitauei]
MNLLVIIVLVFQISSVYSRVEFCYRIVGSKRNTRLGLSLLDGAAFIPEAIYMRIHQMEINQNNPSLIKKDVQYMLQKILSCTSGGSLDFFKLIDDEDYRTLVFVTFSLDVGGKQVVGSLYLDMNTYTQRFNLNCFENTIGLELGVAGNSDSSVKPLETIDGTLTTTVERINSLQNGQVYSIQFLVPSFLTKKYLRGVLIYFMPNTDHIYQSVPRYAEIEISFEDQRGRQLSNPEKIKDIVQIQAVEKRAMQGSEVPFYTTEYMKKHNLRIEIKEPDTGKIWRSVQAFSDGTFSQKAMSNSNSEILGIIPKFVDQTISK